MSNWKTIESAPKDGQRVLLYFPKFGNGPHQEVGYWETQAFNVKPKPYWTGDGERVYGVSWYRNQPPTHWQPLPPAPPAEGE